MNQKYLDTAFSIGASLCRESIWDQDRCNWIGYNSDMIKSQPVSVVKTCTADFYGGTSGIAYFLAALHHATGDKLIRKTALGAAKHALHFAQELELSASSFHSGSLGLGYALFRCGQWLNEEELCKSGIAIIRKIAQHKIAQHEMDTISGPAGAIPVLLLLADELKEKWPIEMAVTMGEYLLDKAVKHEYGWAWETIRGNEKQLTGFAHGTSGIAVAFLELFRKDKNQKWLHAAEQAFAYERNWFNAEQQNWPDFRDFSGQQKKEGHHTCSMAWCHGAPGIGLARLRHWEITGNPQARQEALIAIESTEKSLSNSLTGFLQSSNYSLCHGIAGNVELLQYAEKALGSKNYQPTITQAADTGLKWKNELGFPWRCGTNDGRENPSLMLGLAGIGYYYLRSWNDVEYPSVLLPTAGKGVKKHPVAEKKQVRTKSAKVLR